jgi:hypothetical protein
MNIATPASAFVPAIAAAELQHLVPAAFAEHAAARTGRNYVFISTRELVDALLDAGFAAIRARQGNARKGYDSAYARHMLCFQPLRHSVGLDDAIPQIVLINSHDGRCAYQLRAGLYRPVCTNGLLTRIGDFGLIHVPHRGNVVRNVVDAALGMVREFGGVCDTVERMRRTALEFADQLQLARRALALRYVSEERCPIAPASLLAPRRPADEGCDLWRVLNVVQEHVIRGGIAGRSASGRTTRSRAIRAIREDVRLNNGLWQIALSMIRA